MRHTGWHRAVLCVAIAAATLLGASCGGDDDDSQSTTVAPSGITRLEITSRTTAFDGTTFGAVGAYEKLRGKAYGELNPSDPRNRSSSTSRSLRATRTAASSTRWTSTS